MITLVVYNKQLVFGSYIQPMITGFRGQKCPFLNCLKKYDIPSIVSSRELPTLKFCPKILGQF